jgi:pyruvate-formate lyase
MWDNEAQFLNNFKTQLDKVENVIERESLKNLLLDFNQTFYNTEKPHLFKGINIPGVQLEMADGISPQKDKLRTQADSKMPYIEQHIKTMLDYVKALLRRWEISNQRMHGCPMFYWF